MQIGAFGILVGLTMLVASNFVPFGDSAFVEYMSGLVGGSLCLGGALTVALFGRRREPQAIEG